MDRNRCQWENCSRPQLPVPPCMNTNCGLESDEACRPIRPGAASPQGGQGNGNRPMRTEMSVGSGMAYGPGMMANPETTGRPGVPWGLEMAQDSGMAYGSEAEQRFRMNDGFGRCPERNNNGKSCGSLDAMPIGMGYVPWQQWSKVYPIEKGFVRGTIFPELDLPFVMGRCCQ